MKKLFISQPMGGKTDEEILTERDVAIKAAEELLREPVEVIDSFFQSAPEGMGNEEFLRLCKAKVAEYTNSHMDKTDGKQITVQDVYVVWSCKTLQNSKALLSTTVPDGMYYELTYNGDKHELYFDAYKKFQNICFKL